MRYWLWFWTIMLLVGGGAFAFITGVVIIKGVRDLRNMFSRLKGVEEKDPQSVGTGAKTECEGERPV